MRVIAGRAKGRILTAPKGLDVRPTTDLVKGAIFSMIEAVALARAPDDEEDQPWPFPLVLELFAGTGALGIEALSRGATHVDFVETARRARESIAENLRRTGFLSVGTIHGTSAQVAVSTLTGPYDLILLDPPYDDPALSFILEALGASSILAPAGLLVAEHRRPVRLPARVGRLTLRRSHYHGQSAISMFELASSNQDIPVETEDVSEAIHQAKHRSENANRRALGRAPRRST